MIRCTWSDAYGTSGNLIWQKCFGRTAHDEGHYLSLTSDNGLIVTGITSSNDADVSGNNGYFDLWAVKMLPLPNQIIKPGIEPADFTTFYSESGSLIVNFNGSEKEVIHLQLTDILGRSLLQRTETVSKDPNRIEIPISAISNGIYFLNLVTEKQIISKRVLK